jgi:mannose-1-phosphate guanylyltransferase
MINALIIAGGRGERFWPLSRKECPKQLLPVASERPMIVATIDRIRELIPEKNIFISTRSDLRRSILEILPEIPSSNYILEPISKNTAPAIGLASIIISSIYPGSTMAVLAADHLIIDDVAFRKDLKKAASIAEKTGCLITFGVKPTRPETGYGYLQSGEVIYNDEECKALEVKRFVEKPTLEKANEYVRNDKYFWNSGMFIWTVNAILEAIEKFMPELYNGLLEIQDSFGTPRFEKVLYSTFEKF